MKCPKCGNNSLEDTKGALFECKDRFCGQRFDARDYIEWALKNYNHRIDVNEILRLCQEGVEKDV